MKLHQNLNVTVALLTLVFVSLPLWANIDLYEFSNEANQARYKLLTKELRCPKCQNQDIADSNAPIATDMRREVHRLIEKGESNDLIINFMVERFGEFVSYKPKVKPATYLLWYGPWVLLFIGVVVIIIMAGRRAAKKNSPSSNQAEQHVLTDQHEQVEQLLSRFKED